MGTEIVGREAELAAVRAVVTGPPGDPRGVVLAGPPGIGKSVLWSAGVEAARRSDVLVLAARPAEAETDLAMTGLADLLEPVADVVLPGLTPPQQRALRVALLLADAEPEDGDLDPRALGVAVRSALRSLSADRPVVVAVDDVQWLDPASAEALAFALRRLEPGEDVRVLLSRRQDPTPVEAALGGSLVELPVEPLSEGALQALLHRRLGRSFSRPTMHRLHEASGGNPFYALELARAVDAAEPGAAAGAHPGEAAGLGAHDPLPMPPTLDRLLGDRVRHLPEPTRQALLVAAVAGTPSTELLAAAGVPPEALRAAAVAQVVVVAGDHVRFTHPLLRTAVVSQAAEEERRDAHRLLAAVLADPLARAVHLAATVTTPDPDVAAELEHAARAARTRGAPALAARLGESAARATPADRAEERGWRVRTAARDHLLAGAPGPALALARGLVAEEHAGRARAEALALLGHLEEMSGDVAAGVEHRRQALAESEGEPDLQSQLHEELALALRVTETLGVALPHAREALRLAELVGDQVLAARALGTLAVLAFNSGDPEALDLARRGVAAAQEAGDPDTEAYAVQALGHCLHWSGRVDEARELWTTVLRAAEDRDEPTTSNALWFLAHVEERAGRLAAARTYAERYLDLTRFSGMTGDENDPVVVLPLVRVALVQGEHDLVREMAERALPPDGVRRGPSTGRALLALLATLDRWEGRTEEALARFQEVEDAQQAAGFARVMSVWTGELVECLLELGRTDEAAALVDDWDEQTRRADNVAAAPQVLRCRGLLAAAANDGDRAVELFTAAAAGHEAAYDPFGRARALIGLGQAERRRKQRRAAREAFEAAVSLLDGMGARWWADRARAELGTIGGRTRTEGLTPAEERVAALVAQGKTNREVASTLFLGEGTVEKHLSRIYAKLGVRSRTELARRLS